MLNKIIHFSVNNKLAVGLLMLLWVVYGGYQLTKLPIDAVPDITNNQVQIITTAPSLGAEDVERLITFPIELAVSNVPHVQESRSLSRFGLSLITIVFQDDIDVYWARQQITERLAQIEINENASLPTLAPVTTGLGEIYQYVLKPTEEYKDQYSLADLRTIQDWTVRRQLLGTPGVADVSTFGGDLKQYEVAVDPKKLRGMGTDISEIFEAIERNNENTGGAYIEKDASVLYIRSAGLTQSIEDINNIVIKNNGGIPVLIRHVAEVKLGSAIRYGALTMASEGEVCGGIVMMLKDGNSSEVITSVKQKVSEIQETLPEGLIIEPFLDRTKMVDNAIRTVETNLLEGALIVVFVLVLFLGNIRAGFIVASVIPLSLLFAVIMMNTFGVSGNLMSLGALDFGLIVDGAVIIVEAILHHLYHTKRTTGTSGNIISQQELNQEVTTSASRMMNAAVFGQIIILIVYLPILSLTGIEGKMFKPMAQTVAFAILGAFILSLTYVPMVSSLFLNKRIPTRLTLSDKLMRKIERAYERILTKVLRIRKTLVLVTFALFGVSLFVFSKMGGEFIPQLEEGDFAVETRLLVGTNLSTTIHAIEKISEGLQAAYPEIEKIVSRIGSAEIPTDPMPIEGGDMIIVLKPKSDWTSASDFAELADKMSETAQEIMPGVATGFQYPVQMRFNELMTGSKQDVVCKIFGEDLDQLAKYAQDLGRIARSVDGTVDIYVESVTGMPQIVIDYNRKEIAKYGFDIRTINRTVNAAFAGATAGKVYEGEKSFDLVVRVDGKGRQNIQDVRNLLVTSPTGSQIPLYQLAKIEEVEGPNQIQRENAHRRIIVGFNVRGRDVQSIVQELQDKVAQELPMEAGYTVNYGGAFENLQQAKQRLSFAVPIALLLIFGMLYFAFSSVKDAILIYTAIPLSAIGGIFSLSIRDMPFSISAGIGFIALFGVAVLNGIVLISEFNRLKKDESITSLYDLVITGTKNRLRPVLMTASVASLGFLPMAISHGAGAEVQRPLATVVIGGLITATFLTLFVLPSIYLIFSKFKLKRNSTWPLVVLPLLFLSQRLSAQTAANDSSPIALNKAVEIAEQNNLAVKSSKIRAESVDRLQGTAFDLPMTEISGEYGHLNGPYDDHSIGVSQAISFPAVYKNQGRFLQAQARVSFEDVRRTQQEIRAKIRSLYFEYLALDRRKRLLDKADQIYGQFEEKTASRFLEGEANILEKKAAETQRQQIRNQLVLLNKDITVVLNDFNFLLQDTIVRIPSDSALKYNREVRTRSMVTDLETLPDIKRASHLSDVAYSNWKLAQSRLLPEIKLGYNLQSFQGNHTYRGQELVYSTSDRFGYFSAGISVPVFFHAQKARIKSAELAWQHKRIEVDLAEQQLKNNLNNTLEQVVEYEKVLFYYENQGLKDADLIIQTADQQFVEGEIDYLQWVMLINQAISIESEYINALDNFNQTSIQLSKIYNE